MKSDRLDQPSSSMGGLSGRNDDHAGMLSLKTLAAKVEPAASTRETTLEDSGVIDLKKLMANAEPVDLFPPVLNPADAGLFAVPEITLVPQVVGTQNQANDAQAKATGGRGKWVAAASLMAVAAVGTLIGLHARGLEAQSKSVPQLQNGVAAAARTVSPEPRERAEAPRPQPTPQSVATALPSPAQPKAVQARAPAPQKIRRAVTNPPLRDRARKAEPAAEPKPEVKQPPPEPCDLMCEIRRRATKKK
ncbi:MAG: hypothetical protein IPM54_38230 [Polyangiaceae bacterium]|nr:hypothetical protein [Polyangiaceae bacterium]